MRPILRCLHCPTKLHFCCHRQHETLEYSLRRVARMDQEAIGLRQRQVAPRSRRPDREWFDKPTSRCLRPRMFPRGRSPRCLASRRSERPDATQSMRQRFSARRLALDETLGGPDDVLAGRDNACSLSHPSPAPSTHAAARFRLTENPILCHTNVKREGNRKG